MPKRTYNLHAMLSTEELEKLTNVSASLGITKSEALRMSVNLLITAVEEMEKELLLPSFKEVLASQTWK